MSPTIHLTDYNIHDDHLFNTMDYIPPELSSTQLSNRTNLFTKYVSLEPSEELLKSATREVKAIRKAQHYINEKGLAHKAAAEGAQLELVATDAGYVRKVEEHRRRQRAVLAQLYPTHPRIDSTRENLEGTRSRIQLLRTALYDQSDALGKLTEAAGLLLLVADHIEVLSTACAQSCTASSGSFSSSDDDVGRSRCIPRSEETTRIFPVSSVPGQYRIRYLRKCWSRAADALAAAVALSGFLASQLEKNGETELVPGIESKGKPSLSFFDLPGGLTLMFRSGALQRMEMEAKNMREKVLAWHVRQRRFLNRVRKELSKARETVAKQDKELGELRKTLLAEEFSVAEKHVKNSSSNQPQQNQTNDNTRSGNRNQNLNKEETPSRESQLQLQTNVLNPAEKIIPEPIVESESATVAS